MLAGVPGYANQESFKTAREGRIGGDAPAPGEPFEHATAIEELAQAPPRAKPAGTLEAPEALPQEVGVHESQQRDTDAEQGPGEWPDVTLAGEAPGLCLICGAMWQPGVWFGSANMSMSIPRAASPETSGGPPSALALPGPLCWTLSYEVLAVLLWLASLLAENVSRGLT